MARLKVGPTALTAQNTFTASGVQIRSSITNGNQGRVTIVGTYVGTLTLQSSIDNSTWDDVEDFDADSAYGKNINLGGIGGADALYYRVGFKTGNYTSGTANIEIQASV